MDHKVENKNQFAYENQNFRKLLKIDLPTHSHVLPTSRVVYCTGKHIERVAREQTHKLR